MNFINSAQLDLWAKQASREFLQNQTPLNSSIEKIAHEYSLNAEHIKRISEMANIHTNLELFKQAQDKRIEFPQANHSELIARLDSLEKSASAESGESDEDAPTMNSDYDFPVGVRMGLYQAEPDLSPTTEKVATSLEVESLENMDPHQLMDLLDKTQRVEGELIEEQAKVAAALDLCREELVSDIHQALFDGESSFPEIAAVGLSMFDTPQTKAAAKEELLKAGYELHIQDPVLLPKNELSKLAYAVPEEYISTELESPGAPFIIRNGRQTIWSILDTLVKQRDRPAAYDKPLQLLNDDVKYVKRQLIG